MKFLLLSRKRDRGKPFQPRGFSRVARYKPSDIERKRGQAKRRPCDEIPKRGFPRNNYLSPSLRPPRRPPVISRKVLLNLSKASLRSPVATKA